MSMGQATGLAHIGVFTVDVEKSLEFYRDILGFTFDYAQDLPVDGGVTKLAFVYAGSCIIELIQPADVSVVADRQHGIVDHIAIAVEGLEDLAASVAAKGVTFETAEPATIGLRNGAKTLFFSGPSGERLEFFEYLP